jgi:hypothetical protein
MKRRIKKYQLGSLLGQAPQLIDTFSKDGNEGAKGAGIGGAIGGIAGSLIPIPGAGQVLGAVGSALGQAIGGSQQRAREDIERKRKMFKENTSAMTSFSNAEYRSKNIYGEDFAQTGDKGTRKYTEPLAYYPTSGVVTKNQKGEMYGLFPKYQTGSGKARRDVKRMLNYNIRNRFDPKDLGEGGTQEQANMMNLIDSQRTADLVRSNGSVLGDRLGKKYLRKTQMLESQYSHPYYGGRAEWDHEGGIEPTKADMEKYNKLWNYEAGTRFGKYNTPSTDNITANMKAGMDASKMNHAMNGQGMSKLEKMPDYNSNQYIQGLLANTGQLPQEMYNDPTEMYRKDLTDYKAQQEFVNRRKQNAQYADQYAIKPTDDEAFNDPMYVNHSADWSSYAPRRKKQKGGGEDLRTVIRMGNVMFKPKY